MMRSSVGTRCCASSKAPTTRRYQAKNLLSRAHVFVLPTSYPWEGQPISIIEALAYATPVVATPYRGIPEQVIDGLNGYLIPPGNPQEIARAVGKILQSPDHYQELSQNALTHFQDHFKREVHLQALIKAIAGQERLLTHSV